ncbi:MAG: family 20 glycosylhydrolase [Paramuribaculum sp.]|nr:family 20 glycosylhydrolase [Paramuribaculum sp.]
MKKYLLAASMAAASLTASLAQTTVIWENLGNFTENGKQGHTQRFTVVPDRPLSRIAFNHNGFFSYTPVNPADTFITIIPTYYAIASPRLEKGEPVTIDVLTNTMIFVKADTPAGVHAVDTDGNAVPVNYIRKPLTDRHQQWRVDGKDRMPVAEDIYAENEKFLAAKAPGAYDIVPSFKSVKPGKGTARIKGEKTIAIKHDNPEYVRITVAKNGIVTYEYASEAALRQARRAFNEKVVKPNKGILPVAVIEDYPDYNYRGVMIDVSRDYQPLEAIKKAVAEAALHRINKFQFHFIDDDGWRLEIPSLPELTSVGSRRGYTLDDSEFLAQTFNGNGNPDDTTTSANGFITRAEFIDFLKYCAELGVDVIPEVESPGHSRAAIYAMENRYRRTGDSTLRLKEDGDTSRYRTAQCYTDNVMNPALPSTYKFMEQVIDEIIEMYKEAGVPLVAVHIGGDEVPSSAWSGSPAAQKLMKEKGYTKGSQLHAHFVEQVSRYLSSKGIPMNGWQEIAVNHSPEFDAAVAPTVGGVNAWSTLHPSEKKSLAQALRNGFPIILSNVDRYYLDLIYNYHPEEQGLYWGGAVDELKSLGGYPDELLEVAPDAKGTIIGVQGQLWAETLRNNREMEYMLFPKMLGLAERGWNKNRTFDEADFIRYINDRERPRWEAENITYRLRQPGVMVDSEGMVHVNAPASNLVIKVTADGTDPDFSSESYTAPFALGNAREIRARVYTPDGKRHSHSTIWYDRGAKEKK